MTPKVKCFAAKLSKDHSTSDDAFALDCDKRAFAVADGLSSQPATSGFFAQVVADFFVEDVARFRADVDGKISSPFDGGLAERWLKFEENNGKILENGRQSFVSAGCTMAGVTFVYDENAHEYLVQLTIIGDCAAFLIRDGRWNGANGSGWFSDKEAINHGSDFTGNSLSVNFDEKRVRTNSAPFYDERTSQGLARGGHVILATDGLANWIHERLQETKGDPTAAMEELLAISSESSFGEWARKQWHGRKLSKDDLAMIRISFGDMAVTTPRAGQNELPANATAAKGKPTAIPLPPAKKPSQETSALITASGQAKPSEPSTPMESPETGLTLPSTAPGRRAEKLIPLTSQHPQRSQSDLENLVAKFVSDPLKGESRTFKYELETGEVVKIIRTPTASGKSFSLIVFYLLLLATTTCVFVALFVLKKM